MLELLVAAAISLVLGASGFFFFRAQVRSLIDQSAGLDAVEGARAALDFMANDIRTASLKPTGSCSTCGAGLSNARSDTITVAWDANSNGTLDATESITYAYNSSAKTVTRTINGTTTTLISNVPSGGLSFQYLQSDGSAAAMSGSPASVTTPANVTTVLVTVQVQAKKATNPWSTILASRVTLRNRASALARL
jgi:type II secretory pathway component PulJ